MLDIERMDKVLNKGVLCSDEGVLWWFSHVERMENDSIVKRVYVGECAVVRLQKRWIDIMKDCLKKKRL